MQTDLTSNIDNVCWMHFHVVVCMYMSSLVHVSTFREWMTHLAARYDAARFVASQLQLPREKIGRGQKQLLVTSSSKNAPSSDARSP